MKIGAIIPDRGDRPLFTQHCIRMIQKQTVCPDPVIFINYHSESEACDITQRYRKGYSSMRGMGLDVIFFIENDDWYSPSYIETMLAAWIAAGKPDLFGTRETIYYHMKLFKRYTMHHEQRGPAMSTMIKPDLNFAWCADSDPYADNWLYTQLDYKLWKPEKPICMGMKHGVGKTGGHAHTTKLEAYTEMSTSADDADKKFLKETLDKESFDFYSNYFKNNS